MERWYIKMFDLAQLIVFLATIAAFGYYLHLAGKSKGFLEAIEVFLKQMEEENETDA